MLVGQGGQYLAPARTEQIRLVNDGGTALVLLAITARSAALWMGR